MSMLKKIIGYGILLGSVLLAGCEYDRVGNCGNCSTNVTFGAFNDETYVWESYQFTTNQVMEVK